MSDIEAKKKKFELLFRQCMLICEYFIEVDKRRGKKSSFFMTYKQAYMQSYEEGKSDMRLMSRNISGFRMGLKDLNEQVRHFLTKEEQAELKQRILDVFGSDAV